MAASSFPAGCFVLLGSPATASLFAAGAPPRHVKTTMPVFPAASGNKGGRMAAAVAAGAAVPGGSDDHPLYRKVTIRTSYWPSCFVFHVQSCALHLACVCVYYADLALELDKFVKRMNHHA